MKRAFTALLCVIVVAALLTGAMNIFADAEHSKAGTVEDGILGVGGGGREGGNPRLDFATLGMRNGDFSKGFMYWSSTCSVQGYPSALAEIKTEGDNKYVQFKGNNPDGYEGIKSNIIAVSSSQLAIGDKVTVMFDHKGDKNIQIKAYQVQCGDWVTVCQDMISTSTILRSATLSNPWATYALPAKNAVKESQLAADEEGGAAAGDFAFQITIAVKEKAKPSDAAFDNIRLVKVKDGKYYSLDDGKEIVINNDVAEEDNLIYGTEESGMVYVEAIHKNIPTMKAPHNLDFSEGLRYWGATKGKTTLSDVGSLVTEGSNKYFKLTTETQYLGASSPLFQLSNVKEGDALTVVFDWKGEADLTSFQVYLAQWDMETNRSTGDEVRLANGAGSSAIKIKEASDGGWNTYATNITDKTVFKPTKSDKNFYFKVTFQTMASGKVDFSIDNIRIAKVTNNKKLLTDAVTGEVIYNADAPAGGSGTGGTGTGGTGGIGTGGSSGTSNATGESITMLAALLFVSGAGVFGTAKALKKR